MKICLLTTQDLDAVPFPTDDWPCDPRPFLPEASWDVTVVDKQTAVERVTALTQTSLASTEVSTAAITPSICASSPTPSAPAV